MRRAGFAAGTLLTLALATAAPWPAAERIGVGRVFLPLAPVRVYPTLEPPGTPTALPVRRRTYRPTTAETLADALSRPEALVVPAPGTYKLTRPARVAAGVALGGKGLVTVTGYGLRLYDAHDADVYDITFRDCKGDCLEVKRSYRVVLANLDVSHASDGLLDISGGSTVSVLDTRFHDNVRGLLCGNWQKPNDGREKLVLDRVTFERVNVRTPKAQDCDVVARDLVVLEAREWPVDARGSSIVILNGFRWEGMKINPPGWRTEGAAVVRVLE